MHLFVPSAIIQVDVEFERLAKIGLYEEEEIRRRRNIIICSANYLVIMLYFRSNKIIHWQTTGLVCFGNVNHDKSARRIMDDMEQ